MKKLLLLLSFLSLGLSGCGAIDKLTGGMMGEPDWKTYNSPTFNFSLDSPYPVTFAPESAKTGKGLSGQTKNSMPEPLDIAIFTFKRHWGVQAPMDVFQVDFWIHSLENKTMTYNSKILLDGSMEALEKYSEQKNCKNFKVKKERVMVSGMPATIASGSFEFSKSKITLPIYFQVLILVHKDRYWKLYASYQNEPKFSEVMKKMIKSIKIQAGT